MSYQNQSGFSIIDALAIISFIIGYKNYEENVDQNTMQDAIKGAVSMVHEHLESQDRKIDKILEMLGDKDG